jgi:hypothetical protein
LQAFMEVTDRLVWLRVFVNLAISLFTFQDSASYSGPTASSTSSPLYQSSVILSLDDNIIWAALSIIK